LRDATPARGYLDDHARARPLVGERGEQRQLLERRRAAEMELHLPRHCTCHPRAYIQRATQPDSLSRAK
jgi:hypothetical protein